MVLCVCASTVCTHGASHVRCLLFAWLVLNGLGCGAGVVDPCYNILLCAFGVCFDTIESKLEGATDIIQAILV